MTEQPEVYEFDGLAAPDMVGVVTGIRRFTIYEDADLLSPYAAKAWQCGWNKAECLCTAHAAPNANCSCGFYAYYGADQTESHVGNVTGIIEASGRVIVGSKGFKAEKARVVALIEPGLHSHNAVMDFLIRRQPHSGADAVVIPIGSFGIVSGLVFGLACSPYFFLLFALSMLALLVLYLEDRAFKVYLEETGTYPPLEGEDFERARARYPGVETYPSVKAALKAHPLSKANDFL